MQILSNDYGVGEALRALKIPFEQGYQPDSLAKGFLRDSSDQVSNSFRDTKMSLNAFEKKVLDELRYGDGPDYEVDDDISHLYHDVLHKVTRDRLLATCDDDKYIFVTTTEEIVIGYKSQCEESYLGIIFKDQQGEQLDAKRTYENFMGQDALTVLVI